MFRDICKPCFSNKHSRGDSDILLIEKDALLLQNKTFADIFNSYFQSIIDSLDSFKWPLGSTDQIYGSVDSIIDSFRFHISTKIFFFLSFFILQKLYIVFYPSYVSICKDLQKTIVLSSGPFLQVFTFTIQCICNLWWSESSPSEAIA